MRRPLPKHNHRSAIPNPQCPDGLPYKVDHLAHIIADMSKLRAYNDHFQQRQIMYLYIMISHYIVDA
ncbi:MAG: hypothetical protein JXA57_13715, partial [Armatimonadetes bacterium]|nr:hypothetical protein [Armatimonadota bacterium]